MSLQDSHQISEVKVMLMKGIDGKGISSIEKTGSQGLVDIYTITYTDGTKTTFNVTNGAGGGMSSLFLITSEEGATISVTSPTGRVLDVTPVSGSSTQWQCETVEYGEHTIISVVGGASATSLVDVDVCKIYSVNILHFTAHITATFPEGTSCICVGGGESDFSSSSPHTFDVHSADTYTLSVTYDGTDYTDTVVITTDGQTESVAVPTPADAPVDDLNLWLMYGGVSDTYSTLADVLADPSALASLMSSQWASDYLVRCTTWASTITADQSAMSYIGMNNYCSNTLIADSTWLTAINNSAYFESVLNAKIPTMTSNTTPSGECYGTSTGSGHDYWYAFDGNNSSWWWAHEGAGGGVNQRVGYKFPQKVKASKVKIRSTNYGISYPRLKNYKIQGSDDGVNFVDIQSGTYPTYETDQIVDIPLSDYQYFAVFGIDNYGGQSYSTAVSEFQVWGRVDV